VCTLGKLKSGDSQLIGVAVKANVAGDLTDTGTASSSTPDANPANNTASIVTTVGTSAAASPPNAAGRRGAPFTPPWLPQLLPFESPRRTRGGSTLPGTRRRNPCPTVGVLSCIIE